MSVREPAAAADSDPPSTVLGARSRSARWFYAFARSLVWAFARVWWRLSVEGRERLPTGGPYVLAPVHRSNLDTPIVGVITRRRLRFMGKESLWRTRPSAWLLTLLGGFPVNRGTADREALRACVEVIEAGEPLVMFPEGTRQNGAVVSELFDGPTYVAARTGVPIVPVGIGGSERAMPRGARWIRPVKVHVIVGEPLAPPSRPGDGGRVPRRAVRETTERLRAALQDLFDRARDRAGDPHRPAT